MGIREVQQKLDTLRVAMDASNADLHKCSTLLVELKIELLSLSSIIAGPAASPEKLKELTIARDAYETAAFLSIKLEDPEQFERHMSQLKILYFDCASFLTPSPKQNVILALNLMGLLALNRVAEFHTELELVPVKLRSNEYIAYVLRLEQYLMEGSYAKITSSHRPPDPAFSFFLSTLMVTVRNEIAACSERAYKHITTSVAQKLLSLPSETEFQAFCDTRGWIVKDGVVSFVDSKEQTLSVDLASSMDLVRRTLNYAKELEQIV